MYQTLLGIQQGRNRWGTWEQRPCWFHCWHQSAVGLHAWGTFEKKWIQSQSELRKATCARRNFLSVSYRNFLGIVSITTVQFSFVIFALYSFRSVTSGLQRPSPFTCTGPKRPFSLWMLHWWGVDGSIAREPYPYTQLLMPSTRLEHTIPICHNSDKWALRVSVNLTYTVQAILTLFNTEK